MQSAEFAHEGIPETRATFDEMHLAVAPVLLGSGEHLGGIDLPKLGYRVTEHVSSANVTNIVVAKTLERAKEAS